QIVERAHPNARVIAPARMLPRRVALLEPVAQADDLGSPFRPAARPEAHRHREPYLVKIHDLSLGMVGAAHERHTLPRGRVPRPGNPARLALASEVAPSARDRAVHLRRDLAR